MRWVVATLLLVNLVYFGWELDRSTRIQMQNSISSFRDTRSATRLQLIRELPEPPPVRDAEETIDTVEPESAPAGLEQALVGQLPEIGSVDTAPGLSGGGYCMTYGPLPEASQARGLHDWFRSRNVPASLRQAEQEEQSYFWVYLTPAGSREQAIEVLQDLEQQGVKDYRLIRRGNLENAVSLGIFPDQSAVNTRLAELQGKGFKPVVVPYTNLNSVYWLDVRAGPGPGLREALINGYPARFNSIPVNCDQIAIDATGP